MDLKRVVFNEYIQDKNGECFELIYGKTISDKIKDNKIEHKIIIFKYNKNDYNS